MKTGPDTSIGGNDGRFPTTSWGMIQGIGGANPEARRTCLESLCCRYWKPVYRYVRHAWSKSNEDAKDLTQLFFLWLLEGESLERYDRERGSFRRYLKLILKGFLGHQKEASGRLKRGGGRRVLSLEGLDQTVRESVTRPGELTPDQALDREWVATVTRLAVDRVRAQLDGEGKQILLRVHDGYDAKPPGERPTYAQLAAALGLKATDVTNHLHTVRERIRAEVRRELGETTATPLDLDEEARDLLGE